MWSLVRRKAEEENPGRIKEGNLQVERTAVMVVVILIPGAGRRSTQRTESIEKQEDGKTTSGCGPCPCLELYQRVHSYASKGGCT